MLNMVNMSKVKNCVAQRMKFGSILRCLLFMRGSQSEDSWVAGGGAKLNVCCVVATFGSSLASTLVSRGEV